MTSKSKTASRLSVEWEAWLKDNKLPQISPHDLLMQSFSEESNIELPSDQLAYVYEFLARCERELN